MTLIHLVMVIIIVGILGGGVAGRMVDITDNAHQAIEKYYSGGSVNVAIGALNLQCLRHKGKNPGHPKKHRCKK